ncbi:MAG: protease modulator HflC [Ruminococcaceae bacterium]|nr:protease modulator HflC [Oscillospiraceae bacterium]
MKKGILIGIIAVLLVIVAASSMYTVAENQSVCIFRFSEIVSTTDTAGLHFKIPFIDKAEKFTKATQLYDIPPSEVLTSDKKSMTVDCYILWSISDPQQFYRSLGTVAKAEDRLDALTYNALKTTMSSLSQDDIINEEDGAERNQIYEGIAVEVNKQAAAYGIRVEDVKIKRFDLPDSNLNAVYARMISERNQMAEKFTAEGNLEASKTRNEVDRQVNIMISNAELAATQRIAEGEAEYMRILAAAYDTQEKKDFYEFILALEALKASLTGDNKTVILDADSELAKILMGLGNQ